MPFEPNAWRRARALVPLLLVAACARGALVGSDGGAADGSDNRDIAHNEAAPIADAAVAGEVAGALPLDAVDRPAGKEAPAAPPDVTSDGPDGTVDAVPDAGAGVEAPVESPAPAPDALAESPGSGLACPYGAVGYCGASEFCAFVCAATDEAWGVCEEVPADCTREPDAPVCSCDAITFANDCLRRKAKKNLFRPGPC